MSTLVTGSAGFIGSLVCERLLAKGQEVVGLDSYDDFYDPAIKASNTEIARGHASFTEVREDIRDSSKLAALPESIDTIIHLAARAGVRPSIEQPVLYNDVNVNGTMALLEFAKVRRVCRFIFGSSSSVYGNNDSVPFSERDSVDHPISPYAATKKAGELLCHTYYHLHGMAVLCLRFFTVYGPRQRPDLAIHKFARLMMAGEPIPMFGVGSTERDYTYVDDILQGVEGAVAYLDEHPEAYEIINLGESRTVSLKEMISTLADAIGVEPDIRQLPMQPGDVVRTYADITKARHLLGYSPTTGFEDGIANFVEWLESDATNAM